MFANNFTRRHVRVAAALWLGFAALTLLLLLGGLDHAAQRPLTVAATAAGSALGPMNGAVIREFQPCCLAASLALLPVCLPALAVAAAAQIVRMPDAAWTRAVRLAVWSAGLVVWFGGGIVSLGHALG